MSAPTASRHHADWLSLVEISGPFVSLPVLLRVFSQGLEPREPLQAKALRAAYEEWLDNSGSPGKQRAWLLHVLTSVLGYPVNQVVEGQALPAGLEAKMPEMGEILRPDFALIGPPGTDTSVKAQLLISSYPAEQKLDRPVIGKHWKATPATRMMELLHGADVPLGLVTNGEQWMLVYAPRGEITGYASWFGALWLDEPITLRAFHSLLGVRRFFGVADNTTLLALLKESANDQQEVTDQLGFQVREAVEVLVQSFDAIDKDSGRILLQGVSPTAQYEAALTIMMRLVFLFSAEERGLLHLGKPLYDNNYAVSTLQEQLQEVADQYGEEVLERRTDAWARLLSSFRAVHGGVKHQDLLMQAYGGSLFDPDRYPFLEGRATGSRWRQTAAEPLSVNNRVVLHLLNSLQRLRIKPSAGGVAETRRISFRALGVEQIGHVYEGLLDHTGVIAEETILGIKGPRNKEVEIPLSKLESLLAQGQDKLIEFLKEVTGRSLSAIRKSLDVGNLLDWQKLLIACGHDQALMSRVRPFAQVIREDSFERPLVVLTGSVYVTAGTERRSSGTHYTPPTLTEPIVQHTLEPLVYLGPADGWPREQWTLKSPKDILDLKVCDMAMGSGAFLVQVCRYLADRLVEAWENEERLHPGEILVTPEGKFSAGSPRERLVPAEAAERIAIARRVVADRCLYGVDINPMAVEMAKLSLWLITVDANRPFTFLDHAFKSGDSLLGITSREQLDKFSLRSDSGKLQGFNAPGFSHEIATAIRLREAIEAMPSDTPEQISEKKALFAEAEESVAKLNSAADLLVELELEGLKGKLYDVKREAAADQMIASWAMGLSKLQIDAERRLKPRKCFHWALEFPEIIEAGGFNVFIGNPPFLGGKRIAPTLGDSYQNYLKFAICTEKGAADLCVYFMIRGQSLCSVLNGRVGFVQTNTVSQGDTREVGLATLISKGCTITSATQSMKWPAAGAALEVAIIVLHTGPWKGDCVLDGVRCNKITSYLTSQMQSASPKRLLQNQGLSFIGVTLLGDGFLLTREMADRFIQSDPNCEKFFRPFLNGKDFNSSPNYSPSRLVPDFGDMQEYEVSEFTGIFEHLRNTVGVQRSRLHRQIHEACFWKFWDKRKLLQARIKDKNEVIVKALTSKHFAFDVVPTKFVIDQTLLVFPDVELFPFIQSSIHEVWSLHHGATLENRPRYSLSDCFQPFPFPCDEPRGQIFLALANSLAEISNLYRNTRKRLMLDKNEGLTKVYNRFNDQVETSSGIIDLRRLHVEMDQAIAAAYDWGDINLGHGFHETKQGTRYTISESARHEVLDRLLVLNHQRHIQELAEKSTQPASASSKSARKKIISPLTPGLFD